MLGTMSQPTDGPSVRRPQELLPRAIEPVVAVLEALDPAGLQRPTPCRDYDVRGLVNHFAGTIAWLERMGRRVRADPDDPFGAQQDVTSGDWPALLVERVRAVGAAWADPGAWEGSIEGASMPAEFIGQMALVELLFHGWDLAVAGGQLLPVDEETAQAALDFVTETGEMGRQMGAYGAEVPVAPDAATFDRALGLAGRDPTWRP